MSIAIPPGKRVLVVDDVETNRYILALWLKRAGYEVVEASTGREALEHVENGGLDLVLLDVNLPDMSGYDICETIKSDPATALLPVLHVSASAVETADRTEGLRRGAEGYLVEPVEREELLATVEALLRASISQRTTARLASKLRALNEATFAINESTTLERLVTAIAEQAANLFKETVAVAVSADAQAFVASCGIDGSPSVVPSTPAVLNSADAVLARLPAGAAVPQEPLAAVPLHSGRDLSGVLLLPQSSLIDEENDVVLAQYVRAIGAAVRSMRAHTIERNIAVTLQQAILPEQLSPIPGIEAAVRYAVGSMHAEVGGDFYDLFALDDDRVVFAIGDVMGHSIEAATIMAQIRTAFRSYALEGHTPEAIVDRLNQLLLRFHNDSTATLCCGSLDVRTGACRFANAGHLPALLLAYNKPAVLLGEGGLLLGVPAPPAQAVQFVLMPGDMLVLYTDGLIERRGENIDDALARLVALADAGDTSASDLCDRLLTTVDARSLSDDIALLVIRRPQGDGSVLAI